MALVFTGRGGGGGGTPSAVQAATVALTSAQILALATTPVTLVAAVPGKIIVPINLCGVLTYGTTTYAEAGVPRVFIGPAFSVASWGASVVTIGLPSTVNSAVVADTVGPLQHDQEPTSALIGQPCRLDESGAVTQGDGSLSITTLYYLATP